MAEYRQCEHGFHHPAGPHSCDGCWCEGERDRTQYGWDHNTDPAPEDLILPTCGEIEPQLGNGLFQTTTYRARCRDHNIRGIRSEHRFIAENELDTHHRKVKADHATQTG